MDKQQLNYEFMSIISESHPGLTFEEYRDSCVYLLFYHYLCLKYDHALEDQYKLNAMVRLAVRGKLQMPTFLRFIEQASSFLHLAGSRVQITDLSFYQNLLKIRQLEKEKSYARFFRKLIKKIDSWDCPDLLFDMYGELFEGLLSEFARQKKDSFLSEELVSLFRMVYDCGSSNNIRKVFFPDFQYGILLDTMINDRSECEIFGYDESIIYREIFMMVCYMSKIPEESVHLHTKDHWLKDQDHYGYFDAISIFAPEGSEPGNHIAWVPEEHSVRGYLNSGTKGELPLILSALPLLAEDGVMAVVIPSALLYREGKEAQIRRYLVEEAGSLEMIMLLPDHIFHSTGQNEVMLFFNKGRTDTDIMFFDCSEMESFGQDKLDVIRQSWEKHEHISGFCASVSLDRIRENDYNLNFPRYITRLMKLTEVDLKEKLSRISQIDQELAEIEHKIAMYRRDLELG